MWSGVALIIAKASSVIPWAVVILCTVLVLPSLFIIYEPIMKCLKLSTKVATTTESIDAPVPIIPTAIIETILDIERNSSVYKIRIINLEKKMNKTIIGNKTTNIIDEIETPKAIVNKFFIQSPK